MTLPTMMPDDTNWDLLARFVAGESTVSERATVERWLATDPSHRALLEAVVRDRKSAALRDAWNVDAAWERVRPRLSHARDTSVNELAVAVDDDADPQPALRPHITPPARRWWIPAAAAVVLAAGIGLVWSRVGEDTTDSRSFAVSSEAIEERTSAGERRELTLSDGSRVTLGVASVLRVPAGYGSVRREVELRGEAIFHVTHDEARPFVVITGDTRTEDLGTTFVVRAYPASGEVRVAVSEGAVSLQRAGLRPAAAELRARDVAVVGDSGAPLVRRDQDVTSLFAWSEGKLVFDDAPMSQVADELARWYDVDLRFGDPSLSSRHLTATFSSEPLDEVLRVVGMSLDVRYERRGRAVTLYPNARSTGDARRVTSHLTERRG